MFILAELETFIKERCELKTFPKNYFLCEAGQVENRIYFVQAGAIRAFLATEKEEISIRFAYEGSFINSLASFINQNPSEIYLETIRKTTLYVATKAQFEEFIQQNPEFVSAYNFLLQQLVVSQIEREFDLLTESPTARYQRVLQRSPQLFQQIPAKYIASYLRMQPETLSRIRKQHQEAKK